MTLFCMPFTLLNLLYKEWIFHSFLCPVVNFIQLMSVNGSVSILILLAINRLKAVKNPLLYKSNKSQSKTRLIITVIWIVSICLASIQLFIYSCQSYGTELTSNEDICYCQETWTNNKNKNPLFYGIYTCWIFVESYFIPVSIIIVTYSKMIIEIKKRNSNMKTLVYTKRGSIATLRGDKIPKKVKNET